MFVLKTLIFDFLSGALGFLLKNWKAAILVLLLISSFFYVNSLKNDLENTQTALVEQKVYHKEYVDAYEKEFQKRYVEVVHTNKRLVKDLEKTNEQIERKNQEVETTYSDNRALLDELTRRLSKQQDSGTKGGGWVSTNSSVPTTKATESEPTSRSLQECAQELTEMGREADSLAIDLQAVIQSHKNYLTEIELLNSSTLNGNSKELDKRD